MKSLILSSNFRITIPKNIRKRFNFKKGMKLEIIPYGNLAVIVPVKSLKELKGALHGMDTSNIREKTDRVI